MSLNPNNHFTSEKQALPPYNNQPHAPPAYPNMHPQLAQPGAYGSPPGQQPIYPPSQYQPPPLNAPQQQSLQTTLHQPTLSSPQTFHIYITSTWSHKLQITSTDKTRTLFTVETHSLSKPHVTLASPTGQVVGTVEFHSWSRKIDVTLHGRTFTFTPRGTFKSGFSYPSPGAGGNLLEWKGSSNPVLENAQGKTLARLVHAKMAMSKAGKVEIMPGMDPGMIEEVVLGGVALLECRRRNQTSSSAGGGGGA